MARARNIKPGFYKNEELAECSAWARLLFPGLWMLADREGRLEDRPKRIKGELFPFDSLDVDKLLTELARHGFIIRYQNDDGNFIQINKFLEHQSPHYSEKPSTIKPPSIPVDSRKTPGTKAPLSTKYSENPQAIKRGSQPPDSLNPDSLNPESDLSAVITETTAAPEPPRNPPSGETPQPKPGTMASSAYAAIDALRVGHPPGTELYERAGEIFAVLKANSIPATPAHPQVTEWASKGVTAEQVRQGINQARKSNAGPLNPAYVARCMETLAAAPKAQGWKSDDAKAEALCRDLGIPGAGRGETREAWHARITHALAHPA